MIAPAAGLSPVLFTALSKIESDLKDEPVAFPDQDFRHDHARAVDGKASQIFPRCSTLVSRSIRPVSNCAPAGNDDGIWSSRDSCLTMSGRAENSRSDTRRSSTSSRPGDKNHAVVSADIEAVGYPRLARVARGKLSLVILVRSGPGSICIDIAGTRRISGGWPTRCSAVVKNGLRGALPP